MSDANFSTLKKLSDSQLFAVQLALNAAVCGPTHKPYLWLARTVALRYVNAEINRRKLNRDHEVGSALCEEAPDGN